MELSPLTTGILVVAALLVVFRVWVSSSRPKKPRQRIGSPGPGAAGAFYEMLSQDKRNAIEIIVEEKAAARDEETADDIPPDLKK